MTLDASAWARLSPLLDAALDLAPHERAAWLDALQSRAPDDAQALRVLLASYDNAQGSDFLRGSVPAPGPAPAAVPAGFQLGPWTIESSLGEGGMASVWLARRSDGRYQGHAAIKLMHGRLHGTQARQRFEREGHILARLQHPNIARLLDAGVTQDGDGGQPYLVLELVRGQPIDRWCDERRLDVAARLRLFVDVAQAVAAAHAQLVVHRDIKPANVLVDEQGQVKLLDFGIARLLDDDGETGPSEAPLTRTGQRAFTPAWAAPEQMRGQAVTTAADVWALGVLLCHLLTGRHPSGLPWNSDLPAWMQTATVPSVRRLSKLVGSGEEATALAAARGLQPAGLTRRLQGDLDQIALRSLAEEPERRYASVHALADDVRRHLLHEPVAAVADTVTYRAGKFVRRNRLAVGAASATLLALVAGVLGTTWQAVEARAQRDQAQRARLEAVAQAQRADLERVRAFEQLDRAEAMNELMAYSLGPVSAKPLSVLDVLERGEAMVEKRFRDMPELQVFLKSQLAVYWSYGKERDRMAALLQSARDTAQRTGDTAAVASLECQLAFVDTERGDFASAFARIERSLATLEGEPAEVVEPRATCFRRRAHTHLEQGNQAQALSDIETALALTPSRQGQIARRLGMQATRASILGALGELKPAIQAFEEVLGEASQRGVLDATAQSETYNNFYVVLMRAGQVGRALEAIDQSLLMGQGPGATRGSTWVEQVNRAVALTLLGRTVEALPILQEAMAEARRSGEPRDIGFRAYFYAQALCEAGQWIECRRHQELSSRTLGAILVKDHPTFGGLSVLRARLALARGSAADARAAINEALAIYAGPTQRSGRIAAMTQLARIELQDLQLDAALSAARQAVELAREVFKDFPRSQRGGIAYLELGRVHEARAENSQAREAFAEALAQFEGALGSNSGAAREVRALLSAP